MYKRYLIAKVIQKSSEKKHLIKKIFLYIRGVRFWKKYAYLFFFRLLLRPSPISFAKAERAFA